MAGLIKGFDTNPNFPLEDISEQSVDILAMMLSSPELLTNLHNLAERDVRLYRLGHSAITGKISECIDPSVARAASVGVAVYESMSNLVRQNHENIGFGGILRLKLYERMTPDETLLHLEACEGPFRRHLPGAAEVVREAATSILDHDIEYAVLGAAAARQLDLETA